MPCRHRRSRHGHHRRLNEAITRSLAVGGVAEVLVELSALSFCVATGITALLTGRDSAVGSTYRVVNPHGLVRRVLNIASTLLTDP